MIGTPPDPIEGELCNMLDPWEAFIAMTTGVSNERIARSAASKGSLQVGLTFTFTMSSMNVEAAINTAPAIAISLFGWQVEEPPSFALPGPYLASVPDSSSVIASESEGRVVTAMEAPGFNTMYLEIEANARRYWIAAASTDVRVGSVVRFFGDQAIVLENFESKALKRTFERIYFVSAITVEEVEL